MKYFVLFAFLLAALSGDAQEQPHAAAAWFTDASIENSIRLEAPEGPPPSVPGTVGAGILLDHGFPVEDPLLCQQRGMIGFWIKPNWNGDDGERHSILRIGDPERNGLLVEKSEKGMLRFVMASPKKVTASRSDVSEWRKGDWHHIVVVWMDQDGKPIGLPLWIDRVAVDGPTAADNDFFDQEAMDDSRLWLGDETCDAVMDELIMRDQLSTELSKGQVDLVYRDYFRTAPYTAIEIDPDSSLVPADRRVLAGFSKQFGLKAKQGDELVRITDLTVRYGNWSEFDAKPFITWSTSDDKIATVDENGLVTGHAVGRCKLSAEFRGMKASYSLEVIPVDQPDIDLLYVSRLPRYRAEAEKNRPAPGDGVEFAAHLVNFGFESVPEGTVVRWELIPDKNRNFRLDRGEKPIRSEEKAIDRPLAPREEAEVEFFWHWSDDPIWVRVTADPDDKVSEICEANNQRCALNVARPLRFGYYQETLDSCYDDRKINLVGSFSYPDYIQAQKMRMDIMVRDAVWPETSPVGIQDAYRTDIIYRMPDEDGGDDPQEASEEYYDGGFPVGRHSEFMAMDSGLIHEFGHTCLALPDLYGYVIRAANVLLKDEKGQLFAGTDVLPIVGGSEELSASSASNVPCKVGYTSLMDFCHLWLHPAHAGQVQHFRGFRGGRFWGVQGRHIPYRENYLKVFDVDDNPLVGAAVYVYHVSQVDVQDAGAKYFADRPKFVGNTDADGRFLFPGETDQDWDDPDTDEFEGHYPVWNPFGRVKTDTAFTPNVWSVEGLLLIKIVSGHQTEFCWLPMTEFNREYYRGNIISGTYPIRTSLQPSPGITPIVRPPIPEAIRETNRKPVAVAPEELTVKCGEEFTIDGSKSHDPEGQPLIYRWGEKGTWLSGDLSQTETLTAKAPDEPGDVEYRFYVLDGLRASDPVTIKVHVVKGDTE